MPPKKKKEKNGTFRIITYKKKEKTRKTLPIFRRLCQSSKQKWATPPHIQKKEEKEKGRIDAPVRAQFESLHKLSCA